MSPVFEHEMERMDEAIDRLNGLGYTAQFRIEGGGLVETHSHRRLSPNQVHLDETVRFEGTSDPDDEAMILALSADDGSLKGTLVVHYGADMDRGEGEVLRAIH